MPQPVFEKAVQAESLRTFGVSIETDLVQSEWYDEEGDHRVFERVYATDFSFDHDGAKVSGRFPQPVLVAVENVITADRRWPLYDLGDHIKAVCGQINFDSVKV
ncbi:MAG: hypothetical protein IKE42_28520 [Aquamicrobium sp.]|nr:hypothetical protein [Aquamicrobium sp.]